MALDSRFASFVDTLAVHETEDKGRLHHALAETQHRLHHSLVGVRATGLSVIWLGR